MDGFSKKIAAFRVSELCNGAIHKADGRRQEPQRPFPYSRLQGFSGIVPGKARNGSAGSFVNSIVTVLFTKLLAGSWNDPQGSFQPLAPFTAYGSFRNCTRQNHGMARNHEASGFVNSAVSDNWGGVLITVLSQTHLQSCS